ncbi:MAG: hypothetical protein EOM32_07070 [Spirochaetia bacterium]|nr:hypothetical protein [Spirochaetia bacterium]
MPVVLLSSPFPYLQIRIQGYLYTGLFITAHGSMHGSICKDQKINRLLGQLSVWLFTAFPYQRMFANHMVHHLNPGTIQ